MKNSTISVNKASALDPTADRGFSLKEQLKDPNSKDYFQYDPEKSTVSFTLSNGVRLILQEPKPKTFLFFESWIKTAKEKYQSDSFANLKIAQLSLIKLEIPEGLIISCDSGSKLFGTYTEIDSLEDFLDLLVTFDDVTGVAKSLEFFRDTIESFFNRLREEAKKRADFKEE